MSCKMSILVLVWFVLSSKIWTYTAACNFDDTSGPSLCNRERISGILNRCPKCSHVNNLVSSWEHGEVWSWLGRRNSCSRLSDSSLSPPIISSLFYRHLIPLHGASGTIHFPLKIPPHNTWYGISFFDRLSKCLRRIHLTLVETINSCLWVLSKSLVL